MTTIEDSTVMRAAERVRERALAEGLIDIGYATLDTPIGRRLLAATSVSSFLREYPRGSWNHPPGSTAPAASSTGISAGVCAGSIFRWTGGLWAALAAACSDAFRACHTAGWRATGTWPWRSAPRARLAPWATRSEPTPCRSSSRVTVWCGPAVLSEATEAVCRGSAFSWSSRERCLPAWWRLAPVEQTEEVLGTSDRLPAAGEEVLGDHAAVRQGRDRHRPLIQGSRDLYLMGSGIVAHDETAWRRASSPVIASRRRHGHCDTSMEQPLSSR